MIVAGRVRSRKGAYTLYDVNRKRIRAASCTTWPSATNWCAWAATAASRTACASRRRSPAWWTCTIIRWTRRTARWKSRVVNMCPGCLWGCWPLCSMLMLMLSVIVCVFVRWLHGHRCGDVLETDASARSRRRRAATIHDARPRDQRSQGTRGIRLFQCYRVDIILWVSSCGPTGKSCHRHLPASVVVVQTAAQHWVLRVPDVFAQYSDCDAVVGVVLDQSWGNQRPRGPWYYDSADDDDNKYRRAQFVATHFVCKGECWHGKMGNLNYSIKIIMY